MPTFTEQRLAALQAEYEAGQKMLAELDGKRTSLANTLLRIEGAMQVLRELLEEGQGGAELPAKPASSG
jgi:hypothetical protein